MIELKYCGIAQLIRTDNGEVDEVAIYIDSENRIYPNAKEIDMGQLQRDYKDLNPIRDVVNKVKEKEEKEEEKEPEPNYRENSINEYGESIKKEEKGSENKEKAMQIEKNAEVGDTAKKQEENRSIGSVRGQISLDTMFQGETIRKILNLKEDDVTIAPVSRDKLKELDPEGEYNNKEGFVVIDSKGKQRPLKDDIIEPDLQEGNNSFDKDLTVDEEGNIRKKSNIFSCKVKNRPNVYLSISFDEGTGVRETKISYRSGREGHEEVEFSLLKEEQDDNSERSKYADEQRRTNDGRGKSEELNDRQRLHEENGCKNDKVENIDDYGDNDTHAHITDEQLGELAKETGENKDVLRDRFEREQVKGPDKSAEQIIKEIEEDYDRLQSHNHEN